jgi:NitT/TauT family transport system substrate-binding protein
MKPWVGLFLAVALPARAEIVRIALVRSTTAAPLYVAVAAGYFKEGGLDATLTFLPSDEAVAAAVAGGAADVGLSTLSARFYRAAAASHLKVIGSEAFDQAGFPLFALVGPKGAGLAGAADLPGKRIGIAGDESGVRYALYRIAERFRLDKAAFHPVWVANEAQGLRALKRKRIDAALISYGLALESRRAGGVVLRLSNLVQWQQSAVFASANVLAGRRSLIERFLRAYRRGADGYHSNFLQYDDGGDFIPGPRHEEYLRFIARQTGLAPEVVEATKAYCDPRAAIDTADIARQISFWQAQGKLESTATAGKLIDSTIGP